MIDLKVKNNDINNDNSPSYGKKNLNAKTHNKNNNYDVLLKLKILTVIMIYQKLL
jgi:hypothetical protein